MRIVARASDHLVLGAQAVGARVSELTSSLALAIEMGPCSRTWQKRPARLAAGSNSGAHRVETDLSQLHRRPMDRCRRWTSSRDPGSV
ncbi:hypothetical protein KIP88_05590 [Bradyrhizobium sp. SRL28]|nr:hypothetical protein [Bradyrhizobium sp. SRL28]